MLVRSSYGPPSSAFDTSNKREAIYTSSNGRPEHKELCRVEQLLSWCEVRDPVLVCPHFLRPGPEFRGRAPEPV